MSRAMFTDSIETNLGIIEELLRSMPAGSRHQAKLAAMTVEKAFMGIQRDQQGSAGAALGTAYAFYKIAQRLVETDSRSPGGNLIQLLS